MKADKNKSPILGVRSLCTFKVQNHPNSQREKRKIPKIVKLSDLIGIFDIYIH